DHAPLDDGFASTDFLDFDDKPAAMSQPAVLPGSEDIDFFATAQTPLQSAVKPAEFAPVDETPMWEAPVLPEAVAELEPEPVLAPSEPEPVEPPEAAPVAAVADVPEMATAAAKEEPVAEPIEVAAAEPVLQTEAEAEAEAEPEAELVAEAPEVPEWVAAAVVPEESTASAPSADDPVKAIGPLRIGIALYNVYLNEADEWSRQLASEVGEWALEPHTQVNDSTIALAHSLAGSSATVGFQGLSGMARSFEAALQHLHRQGRGTAEQGTILVAAAEELRRLLHQFAAGFLKEPSDETLAGLREVTASQMPAEPIESRTTFTGFADSPAVAPQAFADVAMEDAEDAIDLADSVDVDLFPIFEEEAAELLPQLGAALRQWAQHPDDPAPRASTLRTLHTLKGSARLAGAMRLGERAHRMESEIEAIGATGVDTAAVEQLLTRFDALQATFEGLRAADTATQTDIAQRAAMAAAEPPKTVAAPAAEVAAAPGPVALEAEAPVR
ncbi:MAG: hybrid sensor histidine kinase/response regulator, partial [Comamonadaceae bacterium]